MNLNARKLLVEALLVSILGWNLCFIDAWNVLSVSLMLMLASLFWMGLSTSRFTVLKWTSLISVGLTVIGLSGLSLALHAYPDSNLLGGWGLVLGPIYWLGGLMSLIAAMAWIVVGLSRLWLGKTKDAA